MYTDPYMYTTAKPTVHITHTKSRALRAGRQIYRIRSVSNLGKDHTGVTWEKRECGSGESDNPEPMSNVLS